jgi:hypothetical protein
LLSAKVVSERVFGFAPTPVPFSVASSNANIHLSPVGSGCLALQKLQGLYLYVLARLVLVSISSLSLDMLIVEKQTKLKSPIQIKIQFETKIQLKIQFKKFLTLNFNFTFKQ